MKFSFSKNIPLVNLDGSTDGRKKLKTKFEATSFFFSEANGE